jgi:hypothetical protein
VIRAYSKTTLSRQEKVNSWDEETELDDLEKGQIGQPDTGRRYETYELSLNK